MTLDSTTVIPFPDSAAWTAIYAEMRRSEHTQLLRYLLRLRGGQVRAKPILQPVLAAKHFRDVRVEIEWKAANRNRLCACIVDAVCAAKIEPWVAPPAARASSRAVSSAPGFE